jgi:hypothetical protein
VAAVRAEWDRSGERWKDYNDGVAVVVVVVVVVVLWCWW